MSQLTLIQQIAVSILPLLFAITLHEAAHGWVALKFGDKTALMLGRVTLNPIKHIDLVGTIIVPAILMTLGGFILGWAKPVPVTWQNLKNPKRDMAFVALAGPFANLFMALLWALIAKFGFYFKDVMPHPGVALIIMGQIGVYINIALMILNLLPLPPLDGSRVVTSIISARAGYYYNQLENYGIFILLALVATGILYKFIRVPVMFLVTLIFNMFGISSS